MATKAQVLNYLQNLDGFTLLTIRELTDERTLAANAGEYIDRKVYQVTGDVEQRRGRVETKFRIKVYNEGNPTLEEAVQDDMIPELFRRQVETYAASLGATKYDVTKVDEINKIAFVTAYTVNTVPNPDEMSVQGKYVVYDDNGTLKHAVDLIS